MANVTKKFIKYLHELAEGCKGKLVLASYGQNPKTGKNITPKIQHFNVGEYKEMARVTKDWAKEKHRNVYTSFVTMRPDLETGRKGGEKDIEKVLAVVADNDDEKAKDWKKRSPVKPTFVIETSQGRFQTFFIFDRPVAPARAKQTAERLCSVTNCDSCTKDISHVWRIPNLPNYPNKKKYDNGRRKEHSNLITKLKGSKYKIDFVKASKTVNNKTRSSKQAPRSWREHLDKPNKDKSNSDLAVILGSSKEGYSKKKILKLIMGSNLSHGRKEDDLKYHFKRQINKIRKDYKDEIKKEEVTMADFKNIFGVKEEYVKEIEDVEFIIPHLLISLHILLIIAETGGSKTAIAFYHMARLLANLGKKVLYIDMDSPASDHKVMFKYAKKYKFNYINPETNRGKSIDESLKYLNAISHSDESLKDHFFFFDTLKKVLNVMQKDNAKDFYNMLRRFTNKGATIILLGHSKKYRDKETGEQIFDGVGDIKNDTDDLIYLEFNKNEKTKDCIVSTYPDKTRGVFGQVSYSVKGDRSKLLKKKLVKEIEFVDIKAEHEIFKNNKTRFKKTKSEIMDALKEFYSFNEIKAAPRTKILNEVKIVGREKMKAFLKDNLIEKIGKRGVLSYKFPSSKAR